MPSPPQPPPDQAPAEPSREAQLQASLERLRARVRQQAAVIASRHEAIDGLKAQLTRVREKLDVRRRSGLTHEVLKHVLPARGRHRVVLPEDVAAAEAREARLAAVSAAYASAAAAAEPEGLTRIEVHGLPWWVPADPERTAEQLAARLDFPLRAILQTRELSVGGVMLDLGANIGRTSIPRALLGDVRLVYAAEPEPRNYACLVRNVVEHGLRGVVLPDQVAIGGARGEVLLRQSPFIGGHRVLTRQSQKVPTVAVEMWPLDAWLPRHGIDPGSVRFVKVDTQGSEVGVLEGAAALLAPGLAAWQIEVDPALLQRAGTSVEALLTLMERHFTHGVDLGAGTPGPRVRPVAQLRESLGYLGGGEHKTDLLVYRAAR